MRKNRALACSGSIRDKIKIKGARKGDYTMLKEKLEGYTKNEIEHTAQGIIFPAIKTYNASAYSGALSSIARDTCAKAFEKAEKDIYTTYEANEILDEVYANVYDYLDN